MAHWEIRTRTEEASGRVDCRNGARRLAYVLYWSDVKQPFSSPFSTHKPDLRNEDIECHFLLSSSLGKIELMAKIGGLIGQGVLSTCLIGLGLATSWRIFFRYLLFACSLDQSLRCQPARASYVGLSQR